MNLLEILIPKRLRNSLYHYINKTPWWVEVSTTKPKCLYYFGPFKNFEEALKHQTGYIEDLIDEKAQGIRSSIKQTEPETLTVFEE